MQEAVEFALFLQSVFPIVFLIGMVLIVMASFANGTTREVFSILFRAGVVFAVLVVALEIVATMDF